MKAQPEYLTEHPVWKSFGEMERGRLWYMLRDASKLNYHMLTREARELMQEQDNKLLQEYFRRMEAYNAQQSAATTAAEQQAAFEQRRQELALAETTLTGLLELNQYIYGIFNHFLATGQAEVTRETLEVLAQQMGLVVLEISEWRRDGEELAFYRAPMDEARLRAIAADMGFVLVGNQRYTDLLRKPTFKELEEDAASRGYVLVHTRTMQQLEVDSQLWHRGAVPPTLTWETWLAERSPDNWDHVREYLSRFGFELVDVRDGSSAFDALLRPGRPTEFDREPETLSEPETPRTEQDARRIAYLEQMAQEGQTEMFNTFMGRLRRRMQETFGANTDLICLRNVTFYRGVLLAIMSRSDATFADLPLAGVQVWHESCMPHNIVGELKAILTKAHGNANFRISDGEAVINVVLGMMRGQVNS